MKKIILIVSMCWGIDAFAISCPNTGSILNEGQPLESVLQLCGKPIAQSISLEETVEIEKWDYFWPLQNGLNQKVSFLFKNNTLVNIQLDKEGTAINYYSMNVCNTTINKNDTKQQILFLCGEPFEKNVIAKSSSKMTKLIYSGNTQATLIFKNNQLIDWQ